MKGNIKNISFIIIAKNEEFAINKCLNSITKLPLDDCQIICVDSASNDSTLNVMKHYRNKFDNYQIFSLTGTLNASVARNMGIKQAVKKYIYFVDGDVELNEDFIKQSIYKIDNDEADACNGILHEITYSSDYSTIVNPKHIRKKCSSAKLVRASGGIFIAKSSTIMDIGPWDENYFRGQDIEYTLRYSKKYKLMAIPVSMGIHHTKVFTKREFGFYKNGYSMLMGNIIRNNVSNIKNTLELLRINRGPITGLAVYLLLLCCGLLRGLYFIPLSLFIVDVCFGLIKGRIMINYILENYITSLFIFIGFFIKKSYSLDYNIIEIE